MKEQVSEAVVRRLNVFNDLISQNILMFLTIGKKCYFFAFPVSSFEYLIISNQSFLLMKLKIGKNQRSVTV